ncbi:MAG: sensor histidine kinase, partial [Blastocatellia bacterium]
FSLIHVSLYLPLFFLVDWPGSKSYLPSAKLAIAAGLNSVFPLGVVVYWMVLGIVIALDFYRQYGQERLRASSLQQQLAEAQLDALKMQLQPHFLFNTLHSLTDMVLEDPREATRMIARLGDFLRLTLDNSGSQLVPLKTELEFLRCYLEIERVRFQDRLVVKIDADPRAEPILVPNLILQPLVENAIRHGISRRIGPGRLDVSARQINRHLEIEIRDDGPGLASEVLAGRQGVGLSNIRERLNCLYGKDGELSLRNDPGGGLIATVKLPASINGTSPVSRKNGARNGA